MSVQKKGLVSGLLFSSFLFWSMPSAGQMMGMMGGGNAMVRHHYVMGNGIPGNYNVTNPLAIDQKIVAEGKKLYQAQCASCHGTSGKGDGVAGQALNPRPANLAFIMGTPMARDSFLFWSISEGGARFKSAMPAFSSMLTEDERWKVIAYLRNM